MEIDWLQAVVTGVVTSLAASLVFFFGLRQFSPKFVIAPKISCTQGNEGEYVHVIKIINKRCRLAHELTIDFLYRWQEVHPDANDGAQPVVLEEYLPGSRTISSISARERWYVRRKEHNNCVRVWKEGLGSGPPCLEEQWKAKQESNPTMMLVVRVKATDALSGVTKTFENSYASYRQSVVKGAYKYGPIFDIAPTIDSPSK